MSNEARTQQAEQILRQRNFEPAIRGTGFPASEQAPGTDGRNRRSAAPVESRSYRLTKRRYMIAADRSSRALHLPAAQR
jgi:hypothetical protein